MMLRKLLTHGFFVVAVTLNSLAGEVELKSLDKLKDGDADKKKYGPYVSVFGGNIDNITGDVAFGGGLGVLGTPYLLDDSEVGSWYGIEVGKTWRSKKWPLALSLEFEGSFLNTELNGRADEATLASLAADGLAAYHTDLNAVFFMLNGHISLDLWRYRARIGKVLAGMRPYVGGGIGGGQLWFRNTFTQSKNQFTGVDTTTTASISPFAVDEFISAWQWYAGLEYSWQDKYSLYAEYREFHFGELEEVTDLIAKGWSLGFRYRY